MEGIKCVVVGDGAVGKTALIITYINDNFPHDYLPTVADKFQRNVSVDNSLYILNIWDTAGQEGYARLRSLSYPDTDVFCMCFSTVSTTSFYNIRDKWIEEVRHYCPEIPYILVGTKTDLRKEGELNNSDIISTEMGEAMSSNMKMYGYAECSSKDNKGVNEIFQKVVRLHVQNKKDIVQKKLAAKKKTCILL